VLLTTENERSGIFQNMFGRRIDELHGDLHAIAAAGRFDRGA
jgi:hypothetical protein